MKNPTEHRIHELLGRRWSPYAFDPTRSVNRDDMAGLLEAARWSMSSNNGQPWRYIVGVKARNAAVWQQVFEVLLEGNQAWAKNAPVLMLGLAARKFEYNGKENSAAFHDLGAASAALTFEATARGLVVHQMRGIDPDKAREIFVIPADIEPFTALAVGYEGRPELVDQRYAERDARKRERKALSEIILHGDL